MDRKVSISTKHFLLYSIHEQQLPYRSNIMFVDFGVRELIYFEKETRQKRR